MPTAATYTIGDLARLTGLNVRTIRYYIAQGLIPASGESGPGAHYGEGHLDRLRLTKRLQAQHLPLSEIRGRLADLSDGDVAGLVATSDAEPEAPPTSALEYVRKLLGTEADAGTEPPPSRSIAPMRLAMRAGLIKTTSAKHLRQADIAEHSETYSAADPGHEFTAMAAPPSAAPAMPRLKDVPAGPPTSRERPPNEPQSLERSQWERLSLGPNLELHVRRPLSRLDQRRVERLITIARQVLKEDGV
jgi:DNA-binding transcriptional MerR regulator